MLDTANKKEKVEVRANLHLLFVNLSKAAWPLSLCILKK